MQALLRPWPAILLCVLMLLAACGAEPAEPVQPQSLPSAFPRTATVFLSQDDLPPIEVLARYDLIVMDSEWAHRKDPSFFTELRQRDPGVILMAYINLVDRPFELGTPAYYSDRYSLWQFTDASTTKFPAQWQARTAAGKPVAQFVQSTMTNLTDVAPRVNGQTFAEYAANWVADTIWSTGVWDGVYLDVWGDRIYGADAGAWDITGSKTDVPDSDIYGSGGPWDRGLTTAETIMRKRMPDALLLANGERSLRSGLIDGRAFESFADVIGDRDPAVDLTRYLTLSHGGSSKVAQHREPGLTLTINTRRAAPSSPEEYRNARFFLTATLLQDGFWAPMGADYGEPDYYDELDGGGRGRGYLGAPLVRDPAPELVTGPFANGIGQVADGVTRRDFTGGIVLHNAGTVARTVSLGGTFQKIRGTQDPLTNNGATVTSVVVPPQDGLILIRPTG